MSRFTRQIHLGAYEQARDVFLSVEAWNLDGQRTVRLTVAHPDPERLIGVVMHATEVVDLIATLTHAFSVAFLDSIAPPPPCVPWTTKPSHQGTDVPEPVDGQPPARVHPAELLEREIKNRGGGK